MAMNPMIVIGCGGSGGKVIASLRRTLEIQLQNAGWEEGIPEAWQLIYVDTPAAQEVDMTYGPATPPTDYVSLSQGMSRYQDVDSSVMNAIGTDGVSRFVGWRPANAAPVAIDLGASQWRAVGRVAAFNGLPAVGRRVQRALTQIASGRAQLERLGVLLGYGDAPVSGSPFVVIVSSLAGGTGAGIFLDVADIVKATEPELYNKVAGVLFTAEVFRDIDNAPGVQPNTLGAISELMSAYSNLDQEYEPLYKSLNVDVAAHAQGKTGINYPFIVGMSTLGGHQLKDIPDAYRAVSETLAATMLSAKVRDDLLQFQVANWPVEQTPNETAWTFGNARRQDGLRIESGVLSSFGSARLSVGVARFGEYARARLARQIVEYLADGYIEQGRSLMNDPQATPEQITDYFVSDLGVRFVEACGLRELNDSMDDGESHDQVLDALLPSSEIDDLWRDWWNQLFSEITSLGGSRPTSFWTQQISQLIPSRLNSFKHNVEARVATGEADLMVTLPRRVLTQVSQYMAQFGVPVTLALVQYAMNHIQEASNQLKREAAEERSKGARAGDGIAAAWQGVPARQDLPSTHEKVREATRRGSAVGYREARATHREHTEKFLRRFHDQVLVKLEQQLRQIQGQLAGDDAREAVRHWPVDDGVPALFAPPPLETCLVAPSTWPGLFDKLLRETAADEEGIRASAEETVRRIVGGGGFSFERDGQPVTIPPALDVEQDWSGGPLQLQVALSVSDIEERARVWLNRRGTVFGDFLGQKLGAYLSPMGPGGAPVPDYQDRLDRFRDGLQRTIDSATPLVDIDQVIFQRVHPNSALGSGKTKLIAEPLPLTSGPAYEIAKRVFETQPGVAPDQLTEFFTDSSADREAVLYVSSLPGAVHPAAVTSLTRPIQSSWNGVRNSSTSVGLFWQNRRARRLDEFVPVAPSVLDQMISGWFVGRLLGRISNPDPEVGFQIAYQHAAGPKIARFPWPLLASGAFNVASPNAKHKWLPAILESLGLAYSLLATEPDILEGYDQLFKLGDGDALEAWVVTGDAGPAAPGVRCQLSGASLAERKTTAENGLRTLSKECFQRLSQQRVVADPAEFFAIPYGFELWERYPSAFAYLEKRLAGLEEIGGLG